MADLECTLGKITPTEIVNAIVNAVNARVEENAPITPATNTKITYDAKGLITSGESATTADIADSTDKRYVTDAESTVIDNTSGTNSGRVAADEHIDWTVDDAKVIHADNYTDTTYDDTDFVDLTTAQSVGGIKTFTAAPVLPSTTIIEVATDTTPQLGGDLDCNGKTLNKSAVRQIADDTLGTGTYTFAYADSDMVQLTATGSITLAVSGFPSGDVAGFIVDCINFGAYTITHQVAWLFAAGTAPTYTTGGTDRILLTSDKDGLITLTVIAQDIKAV